MTVRSARRTPPTGVVAAILAVLLVAIMAARAGATGGISGRVTGPDGEPLAGVTVYAHMIYPYGLPWDMFGESPKRKGVVAWTRTGGDGTYVFTGLEPTPHAWCYDRARHCLSFWPPQGTDFTPKVICSRRGPPALPLTVDDGTTLAGIDVLLAPPTSISGTVTGPDGTPVAGAFVGAEGVVKGYDACYAPRCTTTDGLGRYILTDVYGWAFNDDQYHLKVTTPGAPSWNLYYPGSADPMLFRPAPGQRTEGIDVVVPTPGRIVIEPEPEGFQSAWAFTSSFDENQYWYGDFTMPPGTYRVGLYSPSAGQTTYYPGTFQWEEASPVEVRAGETTSISLTPAPPGTVQGRVVDGSGQPVAGVAVAVEEVLPCALLMLAETDGEGHFSVASSGDRKLHFTKYGFLGGWFAGKTDAGTADLVHFRSGETTTLPDVVLISRGDPGSISGTVTAAGAPTESARVEIWASPPGASPVRTIVPAADGRYEAADVPPDSYLVRFFDGAAGTQFGEKWHPESVSAAMATPVVVEPGLQTGGVDANLGTMGSIAGTLTLNHESPPWWSSQRVCLTDTSGNSIRCTSLATPAGAYSFAGVAPGSYLVAFDTDYSFTKGRWYPGQDSPASATPIAVAPGSAITGVDWDFLSYGTIEGVIQATHGDQGEYLVVVDADSDTVWYRMDWPLPLGPFSISLYPGRYRLLFASTDTKHIPQWYPGTPLASAAQVVEVLPGQTISGINVLLKTYGYNRPPVFTQPDDIGATEGEGYALTLAAADPDGDLLTFGAENVPAGATFDPYGGAFQWRPTCTQAGTYPAIRFTVTDHGRPPLSAEVTVPVSVAARDCAPVLDPIGARSLVAGEALTFQVTASDPEGDPLALEAADLPSGASFNPADGTFAWTPTTSQTGAHAVTFAAYATGDPLQRDAETVTISVGQRSPPVLEPIGARSVIVGERLGFTIAAADPQGGAAVLEAANLPAGAFFDPATGAFAWTPTAPQGGVHHVAFSAVYPGDAAVRDDEIVAISALGPLLFWDDFTHPDQPADPDWVTRSGIWAVRGGVFRSNPQGIAAALTGPRNLAGDNFAAGRITARALLGTVALNAPNLALLFGYRDAQHYRYVRFFPGATEIGQVGTIDSQLPQVVRTSRGLVVGRWRSVRVEIHPGGTVLAFAGGVPLGSLKFSGAVRGNVGVMTRNAQGFLDDFNVWARTVLN